MEFLDDVGNLFLTFEETATVFSKVAIHTLHFHQQCYEGCHFSTSLPTLGIDFLCDYSYPNRCEMVVHCGFNLTNDMGRLPQRFLVVTS